MPDNDVQLHVIEEVFNNIEIMAEWKKHGTIPVEVYRCLKHLTSVINVILKDRKSTQRNVDNAYRFYREGNLDYAVLHCISALNILLGNSNDVPDISNAPNIPEYNRSSKLVRVLARIIHVNDLCKRNGEDVIGVLVKCGAFRDFDVAELAEEIEKNIKIL